MARAAGAGAVGLAGSKWAVDASSDIRQQAAETERAAGCRAGSRQRAGCWVPRAFAHLAQLGSSKPSRWGSNQSNRHGRGAALIKSFKAINTDTALLWPDQIKLI
mmetsp:Transcript_14905/g.37765  ORF Transcript_14905/g.37765 Transcript_14905/m.37765 type:complete len:105 (+) Transcript_14905:1356-1670(+)